MPSPTTIQLRIAERLLIVEKRELCSSSYELEQEESSHGLPFPGVDELVNARDCL